MSTDSRYARPIDEPQWKIAGQFDTVFRWEYASGRDALMSLYEKGKTQQWNTNSRIDWSQDLDPENPQELPDESIAIFGSEVWNRLTRHEKAAVRRHLQAWQLSQFLHGEQGALLVSRPRSPVTISPALDVPGGVAPPRNTPDIPAPARLARNVDCSPR